MAITDSTVVAPDPQVLAGGDADRFAYTDERLRRLADNLINQWKTDIDERIEENRNLREVLITQDEAAQAELVDPSESFIGLRVIDENIMRETPIFLKYMESSPRQLAFIPLAKPPDFPKTIIETEYTKYVRYDGWQMPFYMTFAASALHGWCFVEVISDPTKSSGLAVEYIEYNDLMFRLKSKNVENSELMCRRYRLSPYEFREYAFMYKYDMEIVDRLLGTVKDEDTEKTFDIFKVYFKQRGPTGKTVMCAWYAPDDNSKLLRAPYPHVCGRFDQFGAPVPASKFPFFALRYRQTENEELGRAYGRATLDEYSQEGQTRLMTNYVNATTRASNFYPSLKTDSSTSTQIETGIKLIPNRITLKALDIFSIPYPEPVIGQAINLLSGRNMQSAGQTDYAAQNRKDSRKTATEIDAAQQQASMLSGVAVFTLSQFCLEVYKYIFEIVRDNALAGQNDFLANEEPQHRLELLQTRYNLRPAGDVDFIERDQKIDQFMKFWPIVANTPAAMPFLKKIIQTAFPNEANELTTALQNPQQALTNGLMQILGAIPREQLMQIIPPEAQQQFSQILDEALAASQGAGQPGATPSPQGQPTPPPNPNAPPGGAGQAGG